MHLPRALVLALVLLAPLPVRRAAAQVRNEPLVLLWWNVENLFDPYDDPATEDEEFTPQGALHWTEKKLLLKRIRIGTVLRAIRSYPVYGKYPDIITFAESENRKVFSGTLASAGLGNYLVSYHESRDPRGIDIGLAWNPRNVTFKASKAYRVTLESRSTRDVIVAGFWTSGHPFSVVLNHWPSRSFDAGWTEQYRLAAAEVTRHIVDSLRTRNRDAAIIVMGDFNDPPDSRSVHEVLGSSFERQRVQAMPGKLLYNCWNEVLRGGSYAYRGKWERIDHIMVTASLLEGKQGLRLSNNGFAPFSFPHMFEIAGKKLYATYDKRRYTGGYSDHLPLLLKIDTFVPPSR